MAVWAWLLGASVLAGSAAVAVLVAPRPLHLVALAWMVACVTVALQSAAPIAAFYEDGRALLAALFFGLAGAAGGYWLTAAALVAASRLARRSTPIELPACSGCDDSPVVILSSAEPERYSLAGTAMTVHRLLSTHALQIPAGALPFVFLADKARYRAIASRHPARHSILGLAERVEGRLPSVRGRTLVAWTDGGPSLADLAIAAWQRGCRSMIAVVSGADGSLVPTAALSRAHEALEEARSDLKLIVAPSIWSSEALTERLTERVTEMTKGISLDKVGVALIAEGQPPEWEQAHSAWTERETYFLQRVRLLLAERGLVGHNIRIGWLEWQTPDVTETVRHLAALGCERVIVVPALMPCATLATLVDMEHLISAARLPSEVHVLSLAAWGDEPAMADAIAESIRQAMSSI